MVYHDKNIIMPPVSMPTCKPPERLTLVLYQGRVRVRFVAHINVVIVSRTSPFPTVATQMRCTWQSSEARSEEVSCQLGLSGLLSWPMLSHLRLRLDCRGLQGQYTGRFAPELLALAGTRSVVPEHFVVPSERARFAA